MTTNRIKRIEAKWLAFLLARELATTQDIVAARARQAAMVAERLRRRRRGEGAGRPRYEETGDDRFGRSPRARRPDR